MNFMEEIAKLREEFNNKIDELTKQVKKEEEQEEEKAKMPKGEIWKPQDEFWYIREDICDDELVERSTIDWYSNNWIEIGNAYPTKEKAEFEANREKYTRLFRQYVEQHSEPLDWGNSEQGKWCVYFDYADKSIFFNCRCACKEAGGIYASSKEVLQEAIEFVGEENFKKYILSLEE